MKTRLIALALAGLMLLSLCACATKPAQPLPAEPPVPTEETAPAPTAEPTQAPEVSQSPTETQAPMAETTAQPEPTPTPTPAPTQAPTKKEPTAGEVYAAVSKAAGVSYVDMTSVADAFYTTLDTGDVEDYVYYAPDMSSQIEEVFIARAKPGKTAGVKAACEGRNQAILEDAAFYTATGEYTSDIKLLVEGDWVLLYVGPNAAGAVNAFKNAVR